MCRRNCPFVILNLFQDNELWGEGVGSTLISGITHLSKAPKFTNIYPKRGISVNLPRLCDVGLWGTKAGLGFNIFKEPAAPQMRA